LLRRGVRPGVPKLYKSAFPSTTKRPHIFLGASNSESVYEASLNNPLNDPKPAWRYKFELWKCGDEKIASRSPRKKPAPNPEAGLAALEAVRRKPGDPALALLDLLRNYLIYSPNTPTLRGIAPDQQMKDPVGLSGGGLAQAVRDLRHGRKDNPFLREALSDVRGMIDWAKAFGSAATEGMPLSPSAAASKRVVKFTDRYMAEGRNVLTGYDASEGALYVLFVAVLALHKNTPALFAIDNADHGLNPRLAKTLIEKFCSWLLKSPVPKQVLITTHNPTLLDGLPLLNDKVRLFTVDRTNTGRTVVRRLKVDEKLMAKAKEGWTLSRLWVMGHLGGVPNV